MRVLELGRGPCLGQKPSLGLRVAARRGGKKLECDGALEPEVTRPVDVPHATAAQVPLDPVVRDDVAGSKAAFGVGRSRGAPRRRRRIEDSRLVMRLQQRMQLGTQQQVVRCYAIDKLRARTIGKLERFCQQGLEASPLGGCQAARFVIASRGHHSVPDATRPAPPTSRA